MADRSNVVLRAMCAVVWPESIVAGKMEGPENAFAQVSWLQFDFENSGNCKLYIAWSYELFCMVTYHMQGSLMLLSPT